jgi:hypothetical protein
MHHVVVGHAMPERAAADLVPGSESTLQRTPFHVSAAGTVAGSPAPPSLEPTTMQRLCEAHAIAPNITFVESGRAETVQRTPLYRSTMAPCVADPTATHAVFDVHAIPSNCPGDNGSTVSLHP